MTDTMSGFKLASKCKTTNEHDSDICLNQCNVAARVSSGNFILHNNAAYSLACIVDVKLRPLRSDDSHSLLISGLTLLTALNLVLRSASRSYSMTHRILSCTVEAERPFVLDRLVGNSRGPGFHPSFGLRLGYPHLNIIHHGTGRRGSGA